MDVDIPAVLLQARPFRDVPRESLAVLARSAITRKLERNDHLWQVGDPPTYFSVIRTGLLKIVRPLPSGRETILGLFGPRESIGDVAVIQGINFPAAATVCTTSATVLQIPRNMLLAEMERTPALSMRVAQSLGERMQTFHSKVEILSAGSVEARLASLFLEFAERFGDELDDGTHIIPLALSRQDLADLVSTSFETAIRVMSRWGKQGVIDSGPDSFVLRDIEALETIARTVGGRRPRS